MLDVEAFRRYGKITTAQAADEECKFFLQAAVEALKAKGAAPQPEKCLYVLTVRMLALHYYDNRSLVADKTGEIPEGMTAMVNLLHYTPPETENTEVS